MSRSPTTCIGCGCTDHAACVDAFQHACSWASVHRGLRVGLCTHCAEISRHLIGQTKPDVDFSARRFAELLQDLYEPAEAAQWFDLPHKLLGGESARDLIARGEILKVRQVVDQLVSGAYI